MRLFLGLVLLVLLFVNGCGSNRSSATPAGNVKTQSSEATSDETNVVITRTSTADEVASNSDSETKEIETQPESAKEVVAATTQSDADVAAAPKAQPIDLTRYYHIPAEVLSQSDRFPWRDVPLGKKTLGNVPLEIGGHLTLWGAANARRGANYQEAVTGIEVDRRLESLYVCHVAFFPSDDGTPMLKVVLQYDDGTSAEHEVCYGTDVRDWYASKSGTNETTEPRSKRVWHGPSSLDKSNPPQELQFFMTELKNPDPQRLVKTIDLISLKSQSAPCIMAISTGPAGQIKLDAQPMPEKKVIPAAAQ